MRASNTSSSHGFFLDLREIEGVTERLLICLGEWRLERSPDLISEQSMSTKLGLLGFS